MYNQAVKPSFDSNNEPEKPSFEPQENLFDIEESSGRKLPSRKILLIAGALVVVIAILGLLASLLGSEDTSPEQSASAVPATEIRETVQRFYELLANPSDDICNFFASGVFDPEKPLEACRQWREESFSDIPKLEEPINIDGVERGKSLVLYTLQSETDATPAESSVNTLVGPGQTSEPATNDTTTESAGKSPPGGKSVESRSADETPSTDQTNPQEEVPLEEGFALQGGAVLQETDGEWKIATLAGLPGTTSNENELKGELGEEYALLESGSPLYEITSEETLPLPDNEKPDVTEPPQPANTSDRFDCPGGQKFDLVADVRNEDFRLFGEQAAASGGDIKEASHRSGANKSCLSVRFVDNYASVENLSLRLSHNSWQGTAAASFVLQLGTGVPTAIIETGSGRTRQAKINFRESGDKEKIRVIFDTPPEWKARSAPRQFWFLRSSFQDPLGSGKELFDEGRPAGQIAPQSARNLEGGWPF